MKAASTPCLDGQEILLRVNHLAPVRGQGAKQQRVTTGEAAHTFKPDIVTHSNVTQHDIEA